MDNQAAGWQLSMGDRTKETSFGFFLTRGVETWDRKDRGREFHRARDAKAKRSWSGRGSNPIGTFNSVPWFDLSVWLGVGLDSKVQRYGGCPALSVSNVTSVRLKSILNLIGSHAVKRLKQGWGMGRWARSGYSVVLLSNVPYHTGLRLPWHCQFHAPALCPYGCSIPAPKV